MAAITACREELVKNTSACGHSNRKSANACGSVARESNRLFLSKLKNSR